MRTGHVVELADLAVGSVKIENPDPGAVFEGFPHQLDAMTSEGLETIVEVVYLEADVDEAVVLLRVVPGPVFSPFRGVVLEELEDPVSEA